MEVAVGDVGGSQIVEVVCAEHVGNGFMGAFQDGVSLGVLDRSCFAADTVGLEKLLEFERSEFGAVVMDTLHGAWVTRELGAVDGKSDGFPGFIRDGSDFDPTCGRVDHGDARELMLLFRLGPDRIWTDKIDTKGVPWGSFGFRQG